MPNGTDNWFSKNAPKAQTNWFSQNAPKVDSTPDPTKPDKTALPKPLEMKSEADPIIHRNRMLPGPGGGAPQNYSMPESVAEQGQKDVLQGLGTVAGGVAGGAVTAGSKLPWLIQALARASATGMGAGAGTLAGDPTNPKGALGEAAKTTAELLPAEGAAGAVGKVAESLKAPDQMVKINQLLGAGRREVIPGKMPSTFDQFAANPARGVIKAGLDEKALAKMTPLQRNMAIMHAKDQAGKAIEQMLEQATAAGKKVDITKTLQKFATANPELAKQVEPALIQVFKDAGVQTATFNEITPTEARAIQRGLSSLPKEAQTELRNGIREATRKSVPEVASLDQHYWDLSNAAKATQRSASRALTTDPNAKLRKTIKDYLIKGGATLVGGGAAYGAFKHFSGGNPVP